MRKLIYRFLFGLPPDFNALNRRIIADCFGIRFLHMAYNSRRNRRDALRILRRSL